jgi:hypothetical protein
VVVRAFGNAESPTTAGLKAEVCARGLAAFVLQNGLDGVDVSYQDNTSFNSGVAEQWLVDVTQVLRSLLPFHLISHTIQAYYLDPTRYPSGSYSKVVTQIDSLTDLYPIAYYGQQKTRFDTFRALFVDSGSEIQETAIFQLLARGLKLSKIVIAKSVKADGQGTGFVFAGTLRDIFMQGNIEYGWRAGIVYSSYIDDQSGTAALALMRGMNRT